MNDQRDIVKMGNNLTVSVIVPIYNTEEYLRECIDSILSQTYTDLEIILVDDGSTDNSGVICDEYAEKDSRVRVFHKENGGVSSARNYGLDRVTGEYLSFIDSDDLVKPKYVQIMLETVKKTKADIVVCRLMHGNKNAISDFENYQYKEPLEYKKVSVADYSPNNKYARNNSEAGLFAVSLTEGIRFAQDLWIGEDLLFFHQLLKRAGEFVYVEEQLYYYRYREGSAYNSHYDTRQAIEITARERVSALFNDMSEDSRREFRAAIGLYCKRHCIMALKANIQDKGFIRMLRKKMWKHCSNVVKSKVLSPVSKTGYILALCSPKLYLNVKHKFITGGE